MKFSELDKVFDDRSLAYGAFAMLLVAPDIVDGEDVDVLVTPLHDLVIDHEKQQICFSSGAGQPDDGRDELLAVFSLFINHWPVREILNGDYELLVQLPLAEEDVGVKPRQLVPLAGVHVGIESEEVWLLVRPLAEYPVDILPH